MGPHGVAVWGGGGYYRRGTLTSTSTTTTIATSTLTTTAEREREQPAGTTPDNLQKWQPDQTGCVARRLPPRRNPGRLAVGVPAGPSPLPARLGPDLPRAPLAPCHRPAPQVPGLQPAPLVRGPRRERRRGAFHWRPSGNRLRPGTLGHGLPPVRRPAAGPPHPPRQAVLLPPPAPSSPSPALRLTFFHLGQRVQWREQRFIRAQRYSSRGNLQPPR